MGVAQIKIPSYVQRRAAEGTLRTLAAEMNVTGLIEKWKVLVIDDMKKKRPSEEPSASNANTPKKQPKHRTKHSTSSKCGWRCYMYSLGGCFESCEACKEKNTR